MYQPMTCFHQICGFEVIDTLGHGARSTIYAVKDADGQVYALKRVVKRDAEDQRFLNQAQNEHDVASKLDTPHLRRSYRLIRQRRLMRTRELYVLMEMVDGLTLEQAAPDNLIEVCKICQLVTLGLEAMHTAGFVHADIKPNNILVTDQQNIKIIDFGQSCRIGTVKPRIQGTPDYIAPEQVQRREILPQTDVFNLGATIYWLLTDRHVPTMISKGHPETRLTTDDFPSPSELNPAIPPALSSLVMSCVKNNPEERPDSMARVRDRLDLAIKQLLHPNNNGQS